MVAQGLVVAGLMCELMSTPEKTLLTTPWPRFSWSIAACPDAYQTSWQILVATNPQLLASQRPDMWDSGKTSSTQSLHVPYSGKRLMSNSSYWWQVRIWGRNGEPGPWSEAQCFRTGTLKDGPRETPACPLEVTPVAPVSLVRLAAGHYFVDFGRAAFGTVQLDLTSPEDNQQINVHLGEMRQDRDTRVCRTPPGCVRCSSISVPLKRGRHTCRVEIPHDQRNTGPAAIHMPADTGEVLPFRYCEIENCPEPLEAAQVRQLAVHYPFDDSAARFTSSNAALNQVWDLCKYSIRATSFCGLYVDGDRERIPYEADAYINQLCHYCTDREFTMARRTHEYLMTNPTWPTEWILHSVFIAWADYEYTGDASCLEKWYKDLQAKTLSTLAREDGLIRTHGDRLSTAVMDSVHYTEKRRRFSGEKLKDVVDWPPANFSAGVPGERDGYDMVAVNTVVNAFHYRALVFMARIADVLDKHADAQQFREQAARVHESFNRVFFDPARGIYIDGEGSSHASLHANMFALAFGLVPQSHRATVTRFIKSRGMACSVYGAHYLLEALYVAGEDQYALDLMTSSTDRGWMNMIRAGSTVTLEAWDLKYKGNLDWNHAWGAAPANAIPRFVMGIRPLEPGFAKVLIKPQPSNLEYAEAVHPTIRGPVAVQFRHGSAGFALRIEIPGNMTARVALPCPGAETDAVAEVMRDKAGKAGATVTMDGAAVRAQREGKYLVVDNVPSGPHELTCTAGAS